MSEVALWSLMSGSCRAMSQLWIATGVYVDGADEWQAFYCSGAKYKHTSSDPAPSVGLMPNMSSPRQLMSSQLFVLIMST